MEKSEIWKPIEGFSCNYQISNLGRVKRVKETKDGIKEYLLTPNSSNRYINIGLFKDSKQKNCKLHRLIAIAFIPNPSNKPQVNHINGDKYDNRIENLEWCTCKENVRHSWDTGLRFFTETQKKSNTLRLKGKKGKDSFCSKSIVSECGKYNFYSQKEAAIFFGVSDSYMSSMLNGKKINKFNLKYNK
jgi:hypothetical protein